MKSHFTPSPGAHILVTGVTGFVGKVVLEELLRRKEQLGFERIYLFIRGRKDVSAVERFQKELVSSPCFDLLDSHWPKYCHVISGELTQKSCGLSEEDVKFISDNVTHIIHCAASVEFDLPIEEAANFNITAALNVLELAKTCLNLKNMVSVSTAYVTPWKQGQGLVPEELVTLPLTSSKVYEKILLRQADEELLLKRTGHPNTYTFTKCLAEHLLCERRGQVPLTIVRPSIVSACLKFPYPAWIDSYAAFAGFVSLIGTGHLRVLAADPKSRLDVVPCDVVAERIIDACFSKSLARERVEIRYAVAGLENSPTTKLCADAITAFFRKHPVDRRPEMVFIGKPSPEFALHEMRHHRVPLRIVRTGLKLARKRKQLRMASRVASKLKYLNRAFPYFTSNTFAFEASHKIDASTFSTENYVNLVCLGVYRHLMKKDSSQMSFAGRLHRDQHNDLTWVLNRPKGNWAIRSFSYTLRKALRFCTDQVTFDRPSFERAVATLEPGVLPVLVPTHRSYMDFLLCSFLFFDRPDLGISIPHIAAAEEFSKIPILGELFKHTHAFYIKRGLGKADDALVKQVRSLVERRQTLQFFIEGQRSRSRQFLPPKTGLLRCLQSTGERFQILPIAISYDRVPEEQSLLKELAGEQKSEMQLRALLSWTKKMVKRQVNLGRIHLSCGEPISMNVTSDVKDVCRDVMKQLQHATVTTTHHLKSFLRFANVPHVTLDWLRSSIEKRGGVVVESALDADQCSDFQSELCMRYHWQHHFFVDALERWPDNDALKHHIEVNGFAMPSVSRSQCKDDIRLESLLQALFEPVVRDYQRVVETLGSPEWHPLHVSPRTVVRQSPDAHLPHLEAAFSHLVRTNVLEPCKQFGYRWGQHASQLENYKKKIHPIISEVRLDSKVFVEKSHE